jgi:outer membrane biosynthesis protein TonB
MGVMRYVVLMFVAMLATTTLYAQETKGEEQKTESVNRMAIFGSTRALSTERVSAGNMSAEEADGSGHNLTDNLSHSLQNRGLREALPMPRMAYNVQGKVVVRVRIDKLGNVVHAEYMLEGSTTQDPTLMRLAIEAARRAKFVESDHEDEGTITYNFLIH